MYEMEGPRPVSRHRPADFSASIAPLDYRPGPGTLPAVRSRPAHWVARGSPRRGSGFPLCQRAGVAPKPDSAKYFLRRGAPKPKGSSFPFADRLRAFFSARDSGFPLRHSLKSFPFAGWLRGPPLRASPSPGGTERFPRPEALESAQYRVARGFPRTGGLESAPRRWPGVSPAPVAWSFLLAGGAGLLLAEAPSCPLPGGSGFPFAGSRPWW